MGNLQQRVESLEDGAPGPCPECGHDPDAVVTYSIIWEGDPDAPAESSPPCLRCGNVDVLVVDWEDEVGSGQRSYDHHAKLDDVDFPGSEAPDNDVEGAAAQVPDYPPSWNDEGGG